ncbi:MAG: hypothetical protein NTW59_03710 [Candidatus Diapherotrites archaeon]|nr:hypothetical protein [Candidatus Diapherotrites archaeon]
MEASALKFGKAEAAVAAAVAVSVAAWAFFLGASTLSVNDLFTFKLQVPLQKVASMDFLLSMLLFPITIAIITAAAKKIEKKTLMIASLLGAIVGIIVAMLLFTTLQGFWVLGAFYLIALPLAVETAAMKYSELKSFVSMRTFLATAGRTITVISIGLFVMSAIVLLPQQEQHVQRFEETFIQSIFEGMTSGKTQQQLTSSMVDTVVESQRQTLDTALGNTLFEKLRTKTDIDVIAFVAAADAIREQVNSEQYKQQLAQRFGSSSTDISKKINILEVLKQQMPVIAELEKMLWVLHAFVIVSTFMLLANILFKPMAVVYGLPMEKMLAATPSSKKEEQKKQ